MKESKLYSEFQRLGKVLMAPVLLLPVSGILVGLGSALSMLTSSRSARFWAPSRW